MMDTSPLRSVFRTAWEGIVLLYFALSPVWIGLAVNWLFNLEP